MPEAWGLILLVAGIVFVLFVLFLWAWKVLY